MQLNVTFRNTDSSPALLGRIETLAHRLVRHEPSITRVRAVCQLDGPLAVVEVQASMPGAPLVTKGVSDNLYVAADMAFDKLHSRAAHVRHKHHAQHSAAA